MSVLVLGAAGQVGSHLRELLPDAICWTRAEADLSKPADVADAIREASPDVIVNAAAYTAVDRAEAEPELAWRVNAESVAAIAGAASGLEVPLLHLSTDYVFDGNADGAYTEHDCARPINVYGRTKLAGELAVTAICSRYWILRASWIFSEFGANFVKTMLRLAEQREQLSVVDDQRGVPTYAGDVAAITAALVERLREGLWERPPVLWERPPGRDRGQEPAPTHRQEPAPTAAGIYHIGDGREVSWFQFASEIFREARAVGLISSAPVLKPIPTSEYPTAARRPMNSTLKPSEWLQTALRVAPDWRRGLRRMLNRLNEQENTPR